MNPWNQGCDRYTYNTVWTYVFSNLTTVFGSFTYGLGKWYSCTHESDRKVGIKSLQPQLECSLIHPEKRYTRGRDFDLSFEKVLSIVNRKNEPWTRSRMDLRYPKYDNVVSLPHWSNVKRDGFIRFLQIVKTFKTKEIGYSPTNVI